MLRLSATVHENEKAFDEKLEHIFFLHPYFALFLTGIVAPVVTLVAVAAGTCAIMLPVALMMGWP